MAKKPAVPEKTPLLKYIERRTDAQLGRKNKIVVEISEATGLSAETVYRAARGDRGVSRETAMLISEATGGKVSAAKVLGV